MSELVVYEALAQADEKDEYQGYVRHLVGIHGNVTLFIKPLIDVNDKVQSDCDQQDTTHEEQDEPISDVSLEVQPQVEHCQDGI